MRCAFTPALPSELIEYVLKHGACPSTLIICQPRARFVESVCSFYAREQSATEISNSRWEALNQLVVSRNIAVHFVPTVSHLRAILTSIAIPPPPETQTRQFETSVKRKPAIIVYGLVSLHEDTSQWSTQGLGNTLSVLVDAAVETSRDVIVVEEREGDYLESEEFMAQDRAARKSSRIKRAWQQQVPMLSSNERREGLGAQGGYSGRTVDVARILGRWFHFDEGSWVGDEEE